jgi:hypothetical protein
MKMLLIETPIEQLSPRSGWVGAGDNFLDSKA